MSMKLRTWSYGSTDEVTLCVMGSVLRYRGFGSKLPNNVGITLRCSWNREASVETML